MKCFSAGDYFHKYAKTGHTGVIADQQKHMVLTELYLNVFQNTQLKNVLVPTTMLPYI